MSTYLAKLEQQIAERTRELAQALAEIARLQEKRSRIARGIHHAEASVPAAGLHRKIETDRPLHELFSVREYQVFTLISAGQSLTQIAKALSLSLTTVSTYRARIMEKIDTRSDVETALYAVRHHLVSTSAE